MLVLLSGATEPGKPTACRSVHLRYPAPRSTAFYNEVTVERSARGTYFMACGFDAGYFGIQELANGKKLVLFSVWDPGAQNDPKHVDQSRQVKVLKAGEHVRIQRFGGEGTGAQCFFDYDWKVNEVCRFLVTSQTDGDRTAFAAYFYVAENKSWKHLATFSTLAGGKKLGGYYSFIEDFRRNGASAEQERRAHFGNGWIKSENGQWVALTRAQFTADNNPATNIDAGADAAGFYLATGGATSNEHIQLGGTIDRQPAGIPALPDTG
jgi:hypothetical protein